MYLHFTEAILQIVELQLKSKILGQDFRDENFGLF
jgi:hypothetical protein